MALFRRLSTFLFLLVLALSTLLPLLSSARSTTLAFSEEVEERIPVAEGRSLMKVSLADYGEPSANQGHDPPQSKSRDHRGEDEGRGGGGGGGGAGRANGHRGRRKG